MALLALLAPLLSTSIARADLDAGAAAVAPSPATLDAAPTSADAGGTRLRGGVYAGAGPMAIPALAWSGATFEVQGQVGLRLHPNFSVVLQSGVGYVSMHYSGEQGDDVHGVTVPSSVLAFGSLADLVELGVGPALDVYAWDGSLGSGPFSKPFVAPGGDARLAIHVPLHKKPGLTVAFDARAASAPSDVSRSALLRGALTAGVDWY